MQQDEELIDIPLRKEEIMLSLASIGGASAFKVPDMPDVVIQLEKELRSRYPNVKKFASIIESNNIVMGEILGVVRSPTFLRHLKASVDIKTISHVINLIGVDKTYRLAIAAAIKSIPAGSPLFRTIIDHSAQIATACAEIAGFTHEINISDAYLFGLFRDSGAIGAANSLNDDYASYWQHLLSFPASGTELEADELNIRHDYLGVVATRKWGFGNGQGEGDMLIAIQEHHNYAQLAQFKNHRVRMLIAIGLLAEAIVGEIKGEYYQSGEVDLIRQTALSILGLNDDVRALIMSHLRPALMQRT